MRGTSFANVDATLRVSEIFHSIQGEGPSAGTPAHFVRLQGCSVGCHWCDTKYSWDAGAGREIPAGRIWAEVRGLGEASLLVVTGGEPLEHAGLERLLEQGLELWPRVEVETSGIAPPLLSHPRLFYNVSPKLPSATPTWAATWRASAAWVAEPNATFKIVVGDPPDPDDAVRLIAEHRIPTDRVMLMPEGLSDERVRAHAQGLAALCRERGFRLSPRLHVWLWGAKRGV
jgi:organic radical activating enzyme